MDVFTKKVRSEVMRSVRSKGNKSTELKLIHIFRVNRITGWRRNYPLLGSPDFVFPSSRIVVFADGCFWHGHPCRNIKPKANRSYWQIKIDRNHRRDKAVNRELSKKGWHVLRLWECQIAKRPNFFIYNIRRAIAQSQN
jgi:DNA mismatch endonuclease (patch repair protein)